MSVPPVGEDLRPPVDGPAQAVEYPAQHVLADPQLHAAPQKAHLAAGEVDARGALEQLHQGVALVDLQHLAAPFFPVEQFNLTQLVVGHVLHAPYQHQGTGHFLDRAIFLWHQ